jgi:4-oxalocrotonate tautomerase
MPVVTVQQSPGRTLEQRRLLVQRITEAFQEAYNVGPDSVTIFLQNYDDEHWGKEGLLQVDRKSKISK